MSHTMESVRSEALKVREEYFKSDHSKEGLQRILKAKNGRIEYVFDSNKEESLLISSKGDFDIYLPTDTLDVRNYFTIAHELGHYFLHRDKDSSAEQTFTRNGSNRREWEANWFAAELLMPKEQFSEIAKQYGLNVTRIAEHFGVSKSAVAVRIDVLDLK